MIHILKGEITLSIIHDIIKINYVHAGYLPNYPYHLISDAEMCDAFLSKNTNAQWHGFFVDNYPLITNGLPSEDANMLQNAYYGSDDSDDPESTIGLIPAIMTNLMALKNSAELNYKLPNWIYAYMLGATISINSPYLDRMDLIQLLNLNVSDDAFTAEVSKMCYLESKRWLLKYPPDRRQERPPTMFGEPHVIKSLRLNQYTAL